MTYRQWLPACALLLSFASACSLFNPHSAGRVATSAAATLTAQPPQPTMQATAAPPTPAPPTPTAPAATPVPPTSAPPTLAPSAILGQHTVQKGESLFCIGRAYGVLPSAIAEANGLAANAGLTPGQLLKIPAVRWADIAPDPVCVAQFPSPFASAPGGTPEAILILEPGGGSSVASPVHVAGQADSTFEQSLVVQISDAEGRVIATAPVQIQAELGQRGPFGLDVPFQAASNQPGRITVYATSPRDGGLTHLASVEVTLLAGGAAVLNSGQPHEEFISISSPALLATLSGGTAHITGFSGPTFENQLNVVICGEGGSGAPDLICGTTDNRLGSGTAVVNAPEAGQPGPFAVDVRYSVTATQRGRIVVVDASPRDGGLTHVSTREVTLAP